MINFTTGPVTIIPQVMEAFASAPVSHRSPGFAHMHQAVTSKLNTLLGVADTYILSGSGTLANEAMIAQVALRGKPGLILSNGVFGDRLVAQALRHGLRFTKITPENGLTYSLSEIGQAIEDHSPGWILLCHCESSTGVINPLQQIAAIGKKHQCAIFADCMTTFGAQQVDLTGVAMATASSGKGVGGYPGLALVFSNIQPAASATMPIYLDLLHMQQANGIPFTLSWNLLAALNTAIDHNMNETRWQRLDTHSNMLAQGLGSVLPAVYTGHNNRIFTLAPCGINAQDIGARLAAMGIEVSYRSNYLADNNRLQLALLGQPDIIALTDLLSALHRVNTYYQPAV